MENKTKKNKREIMGKSIECHPDLIEILDKLEEPVREFTWNTVGLSYFQKTRILAQKILARKI